MGYFCIVAILLTVFCSCETAEKDAKSSGAGYESFELKLEKHGKMPAMDLVVSFYPKVDTSKVVATVADSIFKASAECAAKESPDSVSNKPVNLSFVVIEKTIKPDYGAKGGKGFYGCLSEKLNGRQIDGLENVQYHLSLTLKPSSAEIPAK